MTAILKILDAVLNADRDNNILFPDLTDDNKAKAYQVKQVRSIIHKYGLH